MSRRDDTAKPTYVVNEVRESDVTVDWFYGAGRWGTKILQLIALLVAWFFAILPIVVTASALIYRDDPDKGGGTTARVSGCSTPRWCCSPSSP